MDIKCVSTYNEKKNQTIIQYVGMSHKHIIVKSLISFYYASIYIIILNILLLTLSYIYNYVQFSGKVFRR